MKKIWSGILAVCQFILGLVALIAGWLFLASTYIFFITLPAVIVAVVIYLLVRYTGVL